ncbi:outer membrane lipoprotein carrier protein LolA [Halovenus rubra]|uniref:Outer membrane lipoprotein carrier protein LolA n=2 Tax=Halovenus rubra TaxID=869890 RepID=A0ABD5X5M1_9EURY|nr:hypothetical protein [Halovenus rubra]
MGLDRSAVLAVAVVTVIIASGCLSANPLTTAQEEQIIGEFEAAIDDVNEYSATVRTTLFGNETAELLMRVKTRPKTGEVRQEVLEPDNRAGDVIVTNASQTVSYDASENDIFVTALTRSHGQRVIGNMTRLTETHEIYYNGTASAAGTKAHKMTLVPDDQTVAVDTPKTLWLDKDTLFPVKIVTGASNGNREHSMTVRYTDISINPGLSDETFVFDVPKNATVTTPDDIHHSIQEFDRYDALANATTWSVPEPDIPDRFTFDSGTLFAADEQVTLAYTDGTADLFITQAWDDRTWNLDGTPVDIDGTTTYRTDSGPFTTLTWACGETSYRLLGSVSDETLLGIADSLVCS